MQLLWPDVPPFTRLASFSHAKINRQDIDALLPAHYPGALEPMKGKVSWMNIPKRRRSNEHFRIPSHSFDLNLGLLFLRVPTPQHVLPQGGRTNDHSPSLLLWA